MQGFLWRRAIPSTLTKYVNLPGIDAVVNARLRVSHPTTFNDPLEMSPGFANYESSRDLRVRLRNEQFAKKLLTVCNDSGRLGVIAEESRVADIHDVRCFRRALRRAPNARREVESHLAAVSRDQRSPRRFRELAATYHRLCAMTARANDPLLWAYYADGHRGIALHFSTKKIQNLLRRIEYSNRRPNPDYLDYNDPDSQQRTSDLVLSTKSAIWAHEREYRLVVRIYTEDGQPILLCDPPDNHKGSSLPISVPPASRGVDYDPGPTHTAPDQTQTYIAFEPSVLTAVTLGVRFQEAPAVDRERLMAALDEPYYRHVTVFVSELDRDSYKLGLSVFRHGTQGWAAENTYK